jgi:D-alanyl-D-alanine carboxypeptidase/D-alanyl-D-alanine-endopeptidase (penicillin-binding protein 4)
VYAAPSESVGLPVVVSIGGGHGPFTVNNSAKTSAEETNCRIFREPQTRELHVQGQVSLDDVGSGVASVPNPAIDVASHFKKALLEAGVTTSGDAISGRTPSNLLGRTPLCVHSGADLPHCVALLNKDSDSLLGETLIRALGAHRNNIGDVVSGCAEERGVLTDHQLIDDSSHFVDGSGIDPANRTTPRAVCQLLYRIATHQDSELRSAFVTSLGVSGIDGTLRERMKGGGMIGRVRAKTGTLSGAHCLSGYLRKNDGREYAFSLIINDVASVPDSSVRRSMDRVITHLTMC